MPPTTKHSPGMATLFSALGEGAAGGAHAANAAVIVPARGALPASTIAHAALHAEVARAAAELLRFAAKGDLVSLAFANDAEFLVAFLGVARAGCVAAPLNAAYTEEEFRFYMEDAESRLLLVPETSNGLPAPPSANAEKAAAALGIPVVAVSFDFATGTIALKPRDALAEAKAAASAAPAELPTLSPDDEALFLHTSGTTSRPKGVPLTHGNLAASIKNISATYDMEASDRTLIVMPLFHVHGLMCGTLSPLSVGAAIVLPATGRFSASSFWEDVAAHGVNWYTAVPTIHQILLSRHKSGADAEVLKKLPKLRFIRSCSSALAPAILHDLEESFGAPVLEAYAMTEASHQMTSNPLPARGPHKPGSVGKATGIELAILDDDNRPVPQGEQGEVCIRGPNVTKGYRNNPAANEAGFAGGYFHTGDRGYLDPEGYLFLTGRIKELINRGGEKISPLEVDAALLSHPAVADAVSFGAPDEKYGEVVAAAVVLEPAFVGKVTAADVQEYLKSKLAAFKIPQKLFIAESVPKTATGKIQRRFVAEHFLKK
ncbi:hypothetical protein DFJ74DRAFT_649410 [Hyaloraphidium curvatum]|nr:hypothetical protein DFJ74DRAFT_649410 [Hyaloraphidium curvatum]